MEDENLHLDFMGMVDLRGTLPIYNFTAEIQNANLNKLQFTDKPYVLSTHLDMNMSGNNIDNFIGYAKAINTRFTKSEKQLSLVVLPNIAEANGIKHFCWLHRQAGPPSMGICTEGNAGIFLSVMITTSLLYL